MGQHDLTPEECEALLRMARDTLQEHLTRSTQTGRGAGPDPGGRLLEHRGAFVTLHRGSSLRGCIGTFEATEPVLETVRRMAVAAATSDPRFPPVTAKELPRIQIEISVLSPLHEVTADEVQVGDHGIYITQGLRRGVLLPQVATQNHWDRETFLAHTCIKAGLDVEAWKEPATRIEVFTAQVFSEPRLP